MPDPNENAAEDYASQLARGALAERNVNFLLGVERSLRLENVRLTSALEAIAGLEPAPFAFPEDWSEQIAACPECQRYRGHPIQQGICDQHRKPLYQRESHEEFEHKAIGYRAKTIARHALDAVKASVPKGPAGDEGQVGWMGGEFDR